MRLEPRIVFSSGIIGTGKSTTLKKLAADLENSFYIDRDDINQGNLHVSPKRSSELPDFEQYVAKAGIFPDHAQLVETPFGSMIKVDPYNAFYQRHLRDQSYLVQMHIARTNLACGKIPLIDCITMRQIQDGTLQKILDHSSLQGYPKYLIHFIANEEDCYRRNLERSLRDENAKKRVELIKSPKRTCSPLASPEVFHKFMTEEQPMIPEELKNYRALILNTSGHSVEENARRCLEYISS